VLDGITIPNTFTPNRDGVNDTWEVKNLKDYQNCTVLIFDRYGGQVYSSKGYPTAWDGTIGGRRLPTGTYYYIINLNNGTAPLAGWVALIR
jgi:gliding motility-associated-like protein